MDDIADLQRLLSKREYGVAGKLKAIYMGNAQFIGDSRELTQTDPSWLFRG
jgi:hypothetical protein